MKVMPLNYREILAKYKRFMEADRTIKSAIEDARHTLEAAEIRLHQANEKAADFENIIADKTKAFPWLAAALAEYDEQCDREIAQLLELKKRPAPRAAEEVRRIAREKRKVQKRYHFAYFRVKYYESLFPWLRQYVGNDLDDLVAQVDGGMETLDEKDPVQRWMPLAQWKALSEAERNQLALDRYRIRKKRSWEVGLDYERYIGYLFESNGYQVQYFGAVEGLADLGRDLIARRGDETIVAQCKYWRAERTLREKHVFQLYGTAVEYWIKNGGRRLSQEPALFPAKAGFTDVTPELITSTSLSDEARNYAEALGVRLRENEPYDPEYPMIKCNVAKRDGERIYHLPFDQQYDRIVVEPHRGEFYARTVAEAEEAGFRRAWRWKPRPDD